MKTSKMLMPTFLETMNQPGSAKRTGDLLGDLLGKKIESERVESLFSGQKNSNIFSSINFNSGYKTNNQNLAKQVMKSNIERFEAEEELDARQARKKVQQFSKDEKKRSVTDQDAYPEQDSKSTLLYNQLIKPDNDSSINTKKHQDFQSPARVTNPQNKIKPYRRSVTQNDQQQSQISITEYDIQKKQIPESQIEGSMSTIQMEKTQITEGSKKSTVQAHPRNIIKTPYKKKVEFSLQDTDDIIEFQVQKKRQTSNQMEVMNDHNSKKVIRNMERKRSSSQQFEYDPKAQEYQQIKLMNKQETPKQKRSGVKNKDSRASSPHTQNGSLQKYEKMMAESAGWSQNEKDVEEPQQGVSLIQKTFTRHLSMRDDRMKESSYEKNFRLSQQSLLQDSKIKVTEPKKKKDILAETSPSNKLQAPQKSVLGPEKPSSMLSPYSNKNLLGVNLDAINCTSQSSMPLSSNRSSNGGGVKSILKKTNPLHLKKLVEVHQNEVELSVRSMRSIKTTKKKSSQKSVTFAPENIIISVQSYKEYNKDMVLSEKKECCGCQLQQNR